MASPNSLWSLMFVLTVLTAVDTTISKTTSNANQSQVSSSKDKCHNMYTSNNFYAGPNKKVEALLHEIKKELGEMREEIKTLKENKTTGKGKVNFSPKLPKILRATTTYKKFPTFLSQKSFCIISRN